ncbi:hypothetical protein T12_16275 [Trichinella patagoniensis]|uniref:Uncharacterized protein n=1 Tax=Trichinella patagoniensis TaxID=990121 RepID=A0A0V0ZZJ1_9BILA|nr:hypothetical protein T12_16275 [Trichinella patagoniensis]
MNSLYWRNEKKHIYLKILKVYIEPDSRIRISLKIFNQNENWKFISGKIRTKVNVLEVFNT